MPRGRGQARGRKSTTPVKQPEAEAAPELEAYTTGATEQTEADPVVDTQQEQELLDQSQEQSMEGEQIEDNGQAEEPLDESLLEDQPAEGDTSQEVEGGEGNGEGGEGGEEAAAETEYVMDDISALESMPDIDDIEAEKGILRNMQLTDLNLDTWDEDTDPVGHPEKNDFRKDRAGALRLRTIVCGPLNVEDLNLPHVQAIVEECEESRHSYRKTPDGTVKVYAEYVTPSPSRADELMEVIREHHTDLKIQTKPKLLGGRSFKDWCDNEILGLDDLTHVSFKDGNEPESENMLILSNLPRALKDAKELEEHLPGAECVTIALDPSDVPLGLAWVVYADATTRREKLKELKESGLTIRERKIGVSAYIPCKVRMESQFGNQLKSLYQFANKNAETLSHIRKEVLRRRIRFLEHRLRRARKALPWDSEGVVPKEKRENKPGEKHQVRRGTRGGRGRNWDREGGSSSGGYNKRGGRGGGGGGGGGYNKGYNRNRGYGGGGGYDNYGQGGGNYGANMGDLMVGLERVFNRMSQMGGTGGGGSGSYQSGGYGGGNYGGGGYGGGGYSGGGGGYGKRPSDSSYQGGGGKRGRGGYY